MTQNSPYVRPDAQPQDLRDVMDRLRELAEPLEGQMDLFAGDTTETDQLRGEAMTMRCEALGGCDQMSVTWAVFDTPVGSFELNLCDDHLDEAESRVHTLPTGFPGAVSLVLEHPVIHGAATLKESSW